jgi:hypothetical protein
MGAIISMASTTGITDHRGGIQGPPYPRMHPHGTSIQARCLRGSPIGDCIIGIDGQHLLHAPLEAEQSGFARLWGARTMTQAKQGQNDTTIIRRQKHINQAARRPPRATCIGSCLVHSPCVSPNCWLFFSCYAHACMHLPLMVSKRDMTFRLHTLHTTIKTQEYYDFSNGILQSYCSQPGTP